MKKGDKIKLNPDILKKMSKQIPASSGYSKEMMSFRQIISNILKQNQIGSVEDIFPSGNINAKFGNTLIQVNKGQYSIIENKNMTTEIKCIIKEEISKYLKKQNLHEAAIQKAQTELQNLIKSIQAKDTKIVDKRSLDNNTDGEILGQFVVPLLQSLRIKLKDPKGFDKYIKFVKS